MITLNSDCRKPKTDHRRFILISLFLKCIREEYLIYFVRGSAKIAKLECYSQNLIKFVTIRVSVLTFCEYVYCGGDQDKCVPLRLGQPTTSKRKKSISELRIYKNGWMAGFCKVTRKSRLDDCSLYVVVGG